MTIYLTVAISLSVVFEKIAAIAVVDGLNFVLGRVSSVYSTAFLLWILINDFLVLN